MIGAIGSLGSGMGINLLSDRLIKKFSALKDQKAVQHLTNTLREWETQFELEHDGTIVTKGAFYAYFKNYHILENILDYILSSTNSASSEDTFLNDLCKKMAGYLEEETSQALSPSDKALIKEFSASLFSTTKQFLFNQVSLQDRGLLYVLCQNHIALEEIKQILTEQFHLHGQSIELIQEQLFNLMEAPEAEEGLKKKFDSWNSREVKNLGNRYIPEVNIPLDITETFQGAALDRQFKDRFLEKTDQFLISVRWENTQEIRKSCADIARTVTELDFFNLQKESIDCLLSFVDDILETLNQKIDECYQSENKEEHNSTIYQLYRKQILADEFRNFLTSTQVQAAISPYILLSGDGGVGKSHLIADYIESRTASGQGSLLLLGQSISKNHDFLASLPGLIGCKATYYEFFDTMERLAVSRQSRFLICIDALNEGPGIEFWKSTLAGVVEFLETYPHIGLIVSIRTQYENALFANQDALRSKMQHVEHTGFSSVTFEAMHQYFSFYEITTDSIVFPNTEFNNPLFLSLFCKSHQRSHIRLENLSLSAIYKHYIDFEEEQLAQKCGYHKSYRLISKIIEAMISERTRAEGGAVRLSLDAALKLIVDICKQWNVHADIYGALLGAGILTQSIDYHGSEYVHVTYERLEDYFVAKKIVEVYKELPNDQLSEKYSWIVHRPDLLEFLGIVLSEETSIELNEVFSTDSPWEAADIRSAFLYGLMWRKRTTFTSKTWDYINHEILRYKDSFQKFIDLLFALSARSDHPLNAARSFDYFQKFHMPDRDAQFIPVFDALYADQSSALYQLIKWGLNYSREQQVPDNIAEKSALILCWLLISPNTELRDRATKAIICILTSHMKALIALMQKFEEIDDPYILERIYAIAFGCVVNEESSEEMNTLAEYVYTAIFDKDAVYPNILLRTYAKNIIDYAQYMGCLSEGDFSPEKITPPYHSTFPEIPSDEEIEKYELNHKDPAFQNYHWAQNMILDSMKVDYSRNGNSSDYGNFGRYTFQSYFRVWKQLHPMDLKNIAVKRIFELGYNVEKHGPYDRECMNPARIGIQQGKRERIGKKYQWIAFYELAAQVSDHYKITLSSSVFGDYCKEYCRGSFEPNIRNIDPTVLAPLVVKALSNDCHVPYVIPSNTYEEWLADFSLEPSFEQCVTLQHEHQQYLLLSGNYNWTEPKCLGSQSYDFPRKNLWRQILGYIVRKTHLTKLLSALKDSDLMALQMPELQSVSEMYNKEYYWSDANAFFKSPYYGNADWTTISFDSLSFRGKVSIPVRQYHSEWRGELNTWGPETTALSWYKPCEEIFTKLHLRYMKGSNCQFVDSSGELICFDSREVLGDESGFYIRQDKLQDFLNECGYALVWTSLSEKRILSPLGGNWDLPSKEIHMSSVYYLENGKFVKTSEVTIEDKLFY